MSTGALYERTETTGPLTATISHGSTRSGVYRGLQVTGLHRNSARNFIFLILSMMYWTVFCSVSRTVTNGYAIQYI